LRRRENAVAFLQFCIPLLFYFHGLKQTNMRYPVLLIIVTLLFAFSCNNENSNNTSETIAETGPSVKPLVFDKLIGTWQSENYRSFERWTKNNDGTYRSVAFSVKGTDTSWNEQASIYPENDKWVFENTVKGQNNGKAVRFISSAISENSVQFSNPAHDFPTDINYTLPDDNTVHAFIAGPDSKGGKDSIPFNYTRLK
jgi:hypothetical protein